MALLQASDATFYASRPATTLLGDGPVVTGDPVVDAWERELWENPPDDGDGDEAEDDP